MRRFGPLQLFGVLLVVALVSAWVGRRVSAEEKTGSPLVGPGIVRAGNTYRKQLEKGEPELVLIGNSILEAAVEPKQLGGLIGLRCYNLMIHGSASAIWYAGLQGAVLAGDHRPKYVAILFRDIILTHPTYRTDPRYQPWLHYFALGDPLLEELVFDAGTDPLTALMRDHWPLYRDRVEIRDRIEFQAREGLLDSLFGIEPSRFEEALSSTFATDRFVPELATAEEEAAGTATPYRPFFDFDRNVDRSFLPAIIEMTEEAGIELILVRMKPRREVLAEDAADQVPEPVKELLPLYLEKLEAYLAEQGVTFIDMNEEEAIKLEHYAVGDHLNLGTGQRLFTLLLGKRLKAAGVMARK